MLFKKLSAPSLKELFVAELEGMILSGKLEIGAKLPPERELAESMQVSRAVVNSGLDEMEKKGFLVVKPRIGTFVADYRKYGTADTLVSIMQYNGGMLRDKEVRSILEVRIMFMNLAATLAIDNADDASIAGLERHRRFASDIDRYPPPSRSGHCCFLKNQESFCGCLSHIHFLPSHSSATAHIFIISTTLRPVS